MALDFADAHAARIHRDDFLVETGKSPLIFGDELRVEGRQPVARNLKLDLAGLGENRFSAIAIPTIGAARHRRRRLRFKGEIELAESADMSWPTYFAICCGQNYVARRVGLAGGGADW